MALDGTVPYDILFNDTSASEVAFELDLYWVSKADVDPLSYLAKDPMRFPLVHVKDMANSDQQEFTEVGTGTIDFKTIFASPHSRGMRHLFVEQDTIKGDRWQSIKTSLAGLQNALS